MLWDSRFGHGFDPVKVKDVDVVFFESIDTSVDLEKRIEQRLTRALPEIPWEVTNEARVHEWYEAEFGQKIEPYKSVEDAVSTWPEFATSVAVRRADNGTIEVIAPFGLDDLLDGVWRRNPAQVTVEQGRARLARKDPARRWPSVRVEEPETRD